MAELGGIRTAVQTVTQKLQDLKAAIDAFKGSTVAQDALDEIQANIEGLGDTIDEIIADIQGTDVPAEGETPTSNTTAP